MKDNDCVMARLFEELPEDKYKITIDLIEIMTGATDTTPAGIC